MRGCAVSITASALAQACVIAVVVDRHAHGDAGIVDDDIERAEMCRDVVDDLDDVVSGRRHRASMPSPNRRLAAISPATACVASALISVTATLAPSAANTRAVARPMPLAAPVTRTVRPLTERLSSLKSDMMGSGQERLARCRIDKAGTDPQTGQTKLERGVTVTNIGGPADTSPGACRRRPVQGDPAGGVSRKIPRLSAARSREKTRNRCRGSKRSLAAQISSANSSTGRSWE